MNRMNKLLQALMPECAGGRLDSPAALKGNDREFLMQSTRKRENVAEGWG